MVYLLFCREQFVQSFAANDGKRIANWLLKRFSEKFFNIEVVELGRVIHVYQRLERIGEESKLILLESFDIFEEMPL